MGGSLNPVARLYLHDLVDGLGVSYCSIEHRASKTTALSCVSQCDAPSDLARSFSSSGRISGAYLKRCNNKFMR
jgi:hypothetical protein